MERRSFIKKAALGTAGLLAPTILPTGRLFAATGSRKANHVVFCLFSGGVRTLETTLKNEGNLLPNLLKGNESISVDIASGIDAMPSNPLPKSLQEYGTLFSNMTFSSGPTGHFNGHTTAITGQHTNSSLSLRSNPPFPTIFELYRKHNSPVHAAKNAWWLSHSNNLYPLLNHSSHPEYGASFAANMIAPNPFFQWDVSVNLRHELQFTDQKAAVISDLQEYMNSNFRKTYALNGSVQNNDNDRKAIVDWMTTLQNKAVSGQLSNPWNVSPYMNSDQYSLFFAEELIKSFQPELLVVNLFNVDVAHTDFTGYCNYLHRADYGVAHLWNTIQSTPGMKDDTILIVMPEIGRNLTVNGIMDNYGRFALDHTNGDPLSRDVFGLVIGPAGVVKQNHNSTDLCATVDVVPTIANILGFDNELPFNLPGSVLTEAFE